MATKRTPAAPADLVDRGRAFWRIIHRTYELNADELQLLAEMCRVLDDCDRLREQVDQDGQMVTGSTGQKRLHPAVSELRAARHLLAKLIGQLGLPDPDTEVAQSPAQRRAQKAAQSRWAQKKHRDEKRQEAHRGETS